METARQTMAKGYDMKSIQKVIIITLISALCSAGYAQKLHPGFDKTEYIELMKLSAQFGDSAYRAAIPPPPQYKLAYRSPAMGLDNLWELWISDEHVAVVSIRGSTEKNESWLANLYAAMVPAQGELQIGEEEMFSYQLASHPRAAVHVGWLVSTAFLEKDILPKLDSCYQAGIKDVLIIGHSQGGAIAYLLTAHLYHLQQQQQLPADLQLKTYCSAAPKPGNLYFAYEYEALTQDGWGYNVVNSADWVPEFPVSIQTLDDFNEPNPFTNIQEIIRKQKFRARIALNMAYKKLYKPTKKAQKNYQSILGDYTSRNVRNAIPGFEAPTFYNSNHYVRTGTTIVLQADEEYYAWNPMRKDQLFAHHFHLPYLYLTEKLSFNSSFQATSTMHDKLSGNWELDYLSGPRIAFEGLFPDKKPQIKFNQTTRKVEGNSGCNGYAAKYTLDGNNISFGEPDPTTMMYCGEGERFFLNTMGKINNYAIDEDGKLNLMIDDVSMMRFKKTSA